MEKKKTTEKKSDKLVLVCFMGFLYPVKKSEVKAFKAFLRDQER